MSFKKLALILLFAWCFIPASAQNLALNYYSTGTGKNITTNYSFVFPKSELGFGIGYNINPSTNVYNQGNIYYKCQFATENAQFINLNVFYHRYIFEELKAIHPFVFYDFHAKHSTAMNNFGSDYWGYHNITFHGPYYWLDNTIGLGFNVNVAGNWYLQQKIGLGAHFIIPSQATSDIVNTSMDMYRSFDWEFIGLLNIGVVYKLEKTKQ